VPRVIQLRVQLQRPEPGLRAGVVRQALHRLLRRRLVEAELVGGGPAGRARGEERRIRIVGRDCARRGSEDGRPTGGQKQEATPHVFSLGVGTLVLLPPERGGVRLRLFRTCIGVATDAPVSRRADASAMKTSYSVVWREGEGPLARGKLEFLSKQLRLDGLGPTSSASRE